MHSKIGQKFPIASAFIMKILYNFYISKAYSYARVKKSKLGKGAHEPKAQTAGTYPGFLNLKHA